MKLEAKPINKIVQSKWKLDIFICLLSTCGEKELVCTLVFN